jgi:hypothetical protein
MMIIDVAISGDRIVITKEIEKLLKYTSFTSRRNTAYAECKSKLIEIIRTTVTIYRSFR